MAVLEAPQVSAKGLFDLTGKVAVIVVGDIDGASIEKQIVDGFSSIAPRAPERPAVDMGNVASFTGLRTLFHSEPEAPDTQIAIETFR